MVTDKQKANLVPQNKRTKSEQREIARLGGIASGQSRGIYAAINKYLALGVSAKEDKEIKKAIGLNEKARMKQRDLIAIKLIEKARMGNIRAIRLLTEITGDLNKQVQMDVTSGGNALDIFAGLTERQVDNIIERLARDE